MQLNILCFAALGLAVQAIEEVIDDAGVLLQLRRETETEQVVTDACTAADEDPWVTGSYSECCAGLAQALTKDPDSNNMHYVCRKAACLCSFDIDRTQTGKQGDMTQCPKDEVIPGVYDTAYGGGDLTLSVASQGLKRSFCDTEQCFIAVVTAGDASGYKSKEREVLVKRLSAGGRLVSEEWCGPSEYHDARATCENLKVTSPLVVGCRDGTKQYAVDSIRQWLESKYDVAIPKSRVWHYDDRADNVAPFRGTGMNARQVSCASRDGDVGLCGATVDEIRNDDGVIMC